MLNPRYFHIFTIIITLAAVLGLTACGNIKTEASYPDRLEGSDKIVYSDEERVTAFSDSGGLTKIFGVGEKENTAGNGGGIGVNSFLWRATLDTLSFIPIASADPFGGVILTDWYENPEVQGERFKMNVYILDKHLRADALRISVFKQKLEDGNWRDIKTAGGMNTSIENTILTRAREMRIAQVKPK